MKKFIQVYSISLSSPVKIVKEKIEVVDDENRTLLYRVIDGGLLNYFKHLKGHLSVTPKGEGSLVKWSYEYEKASQEVPKPDMVKEFVVKTLQKKE
ncbi:MLP-like protein 423, partial [Mucuna pruriens]